MKQYNDFSQFYKESSFRNNVLMWYPFKINSQFLYIGNVSSYRFLKTKGQVDYFESDSFNNELQTDSFYDYIIFEDVLDNQEDKNQLLTYAFSHLKEDGSIIILADNKLAVRYFAGVKYNDISFGNLSSKNYLYTKREWDNIINKYTENYTYFYPYPNYQFCEYIFSKAPKASDIKDTFQTYYKTRNIYFDETKALDTIIESGYFEDFSNSFMIVINNQTDIEYVKFAQERRNEYKIYTTIEEVNKKKIVEKICTEDTGIQHFENIESYYKMFSSKNLDSKFKYCPVKLDGNKLIFDYIDGCSLEEIVDRLVKNHDIEGIKAQLNIIDKIASVSNSCEFIENETFDKVFTAQDYTLIKDMECYEWANIDLIFGNILVNDFYNVIDYEWVFKCTIPKSFIIFRTLLHSQSISKLSKEEIQELYDSFGIKYELFNLFLKMEMGFQKYVSDYKIQDYFNEFGCISLEQKDLSGNVKSISIIQGDTTQNRLLGDVKEFKLDFDINPDLDVTIFIPKNSIMKIINISLDGNRINFDTNADAVIGEDYYFSSEVHIQIKNNNYKKLQFEGLYYYYNDDCINGMIDVIKNNIRLQQKLDQLREHRVVRMIEKMGDKNGC